MGKRKISELIKEKQFWEIIEDSQNCKMLRDQLEKLSGDEILGYVYWWEYFSCILARTPEIGAVAHIVIGEEGDNLFNNCVKRKWLENWLITRGELVVKNAIKNADSICDELCKLSYNEFPVRRSVRYIPELVFNYKFGKDINDVSENYECDWLSVPERKFTWKIDDPKSIRKVCPKTYNRWWNDNRFRGYHEEPQDLSWRSHGDRVDTDKVKETKSIGALQGYRIEIEDLGKDSFKVTLPNLYFNVNGRSVEGFIKKLKNDLIDNLMEPDEGTVPMTKVIRFRDIVNKLADLYEKKNADYGDSFGETWKTLGSVSALTRMNDKLNRLNTLLGDKNQQQVKQESVKDTLLDLAAYAIMTVMEIEGEG
jgi:hypothetical protein